MFNLLVESTRTEAETRRPFALLSALLIHLALLAALLFIPLITPEKLSAQLTGFLKLASPPPLLGSSSRIATPKRKPGSMMSQDGLILQTPPVIPNRAPAISLAGAQELLRTEPGDTSGISLGFPRGGSDGIVGGDASRSSPRLPLPVPPHVLTVTHPVRVGGDVQQANLISQVKPKYPALAKQARIQGAVVLEAVIGRGGNIVDLKVIKGHPLLIPEALEAVKQWRYRPTLLNREPVEVLTTITVNFSLGG